jgi:excisionase family DNA binding protein
MPVRTDAPLFLSVSEAALLLGVNAATVRRWIHEQRLGAVQVGGEQGVIRIPTTELERLVAEAREAT